MRSLAVAPSAVVEIELLTGRFAVSLQALIVCSNLGRVTTCTAF
jgi:hypothetical protein